MLNAIQEDYYLNAKNPSDNDVLLSLGQKIGLDMAQFEAEFLSQQNDQRLLDEIDFARSIGGNSFPSLIMQTSDSVIQLPIDYQNAATTIAQIRSMI